MIITTTRTALRRFFGSVRLISGTAAVQKVSPSKKNEKTSVQVAVLGCSSPLGRFVTLMLKQNPLLSNLHLFGENACFLAFDLNFMDTRCKAVAYEYDDKCIGKAIRSADIILMLGECPKHPSLSISDLVMQEGDRVMSYVKACTKHAPRSVVVVAIPPVSAYTALVRAAFKKTPWYHPGRVIGSAGFAEVKANCILAQHTQIDHSLINVPIVGGPDIETAVPLFSKASPAGLPISDCCKLLSAFRGVREADFPKQMVKENYFEMSVLGEATGLNRLITRLAFGLCGDNNSCSCAFVRTNILPTCQHLVTTVQFGPTGVIHNFGIPELNKLELSLLDRAMQDIKVREQMAREFSEYVDMEGYKSDPAFAIKHQLIEDEKQKKIVRPLGHL